MEAKYLSKQKIYKYLYLKIYFMVYLKIYYLFKITHQIEYSSEYSYLFQLTNLIHFFIENY